MSVIIKGIEMPRRCIACPIGFFDNEYDILHCPLTVEEIHRTDFVYKRSENCPLIPVPPHGDLIDRDAIKETFCGNCFADEKPMECPEPCMDMRIILDAPTIIPAEEEVLDT